MSSIKKGRGLKRENIPLRLAFIGKKGFTKNVGKSSSLIIPQIHKQNLKNKKGGSPFIKGGWGDSIHNLASVLSPKDSIKENL